MKRNEIIQEIVSIIKIIVSDSSDTERLDLDGYPIITENTFLFQTGLNLSSIDGIMLFVNIEEKFGVQWPDELLAFNESLTVGEIADIIDNLQQ